jgi:hypothetical protein
MSYIKDEVHKLAEQLPDSATWDEVMYEVYVRQRIADGERALAEGRTVPHDEVKKRFALASGSFGRNRPSPICRRSATTLLETPDTMPDVLLRSSTSLLPSASLCLVTSGGLGRKSAFIETPVMGEQRPSPANGRGRG